MAGKAKASKPTAKAKPKKITGKSVTSIPKDQEYKPTIYLDDKQIPSTLKDAKVGSTVSFMVNAKVVGKSQRDDGSGVSNSLQIEVNKINPATKKK